MQTSMVKNIIQLLNEPVFLVDLKGNILSHNYPENTALFNNYFQVEPKIINLNICDDLKVEIIFKIANVKSECKIVEFTPWLVTIKKIDESILLLFIDKSNKIIDNHKLKTEIQDIFYRKFDAFAYKIKLNKTENELIYISNSIKDVYGLSKYQFIEESKNGVLLDRFHKDDVELITNFSKEIKVLKKETSIRYRFKKGNETNYSWFEENVFPTESDRGKVESYTGIIRNINKQKNIVNIADKLTKILFSDNLYSNQINESLATAGSIIGVDRAYIFKFNIENNLHVSSQIFEWVNDGIKPEIENTELQNFPFEQYFPEVINYLEAENKYA